MIPLTITYQLRKNKEFIRHVQRATMTTDEFGIEPTHGLFGSTEWWNELLVCGLYVVIEGWKELKLHDPVIDGLLTSPNVDLLRRYRNGVFHFQPEYMDKRFRGFVEEGTEPVAWVRELNKQFGRFFLEQPHG